VVTFGGQSLPDLSVVPPSRTNGALELTVGLGDSITWRPGSWFRRVCGAGVLATCRDAGIRGDSTAGMVARLDTDVLALHPDVVTVMAGTNDLLIDFDAKQTMRNLNEIVSRTRTSGAKVVLCTIPPRNRTPTEVLVLNAAIRKYADTHGVALLDLYPLLGTRAGTFRKGLTHDGVHPNATGMRKMAGYAEQKLPGLIGTGTGTGG
jgi:lysophospholipase L1-like esterase